MSRRPVIVLVLCLVLAALAAVRCSGRGALDVSESAVAAPAAAAPVAAAPAAPALPATVAAPVLERDLWYVGHIAGQPAASMHMVVQKLPDGGRRSQLDTRFVLSRKLGNATSVFSLSESQVLDEDAAGTVTTFRLEQDQNGSLTTAVGTVVGREIVATVHRLGRATEQRLAIPEGVAVLGQQAGQEVLVRHPPAVGGAVKSASVALLGQLAVVVTTATLQEKRADGTFLYQLATEVAPPATAVIDAQGDVVSMEMDAVFIKIALTRSEGPVALLGAEFAPTGLVQAKGPAPRAAPRNRYRLVPAALARLPEDPFHSITDGVLTVVSEAAATALPDPAPLLAAEPQLEIDDPELRAWVEDIRTRAGDVGTARLAETLRLYVRARIVGKDLSKGDGSALEAFRDRRGDCTEHANLLTAALRIAGIPARCDVGVVYASDFGGWVGHAWTSAWWDGAWHHLDAAYPNVARSCYLTLGTTSGDRMGTLAAMTKAFTAIAGTEVETLAE